MDLVVINESTPRRLAFYLAEEEYLAKAYPDRELFFAWQVKPTVIIGRHQLLEKEINVAACREHGIDIVRRKSGGGAVLADMNNIMFSYITSSDDVCTTFSHYTSMVASALRSLGLDASDNSRNDILIGDRKVSGNSYYHLPGRSIVHGTMLYDFDPDLMAKTLRPSAEKLASHGVKSTRSRVTRIREHLPELSLPDFLRHVLDTVASSGSVITLAPDEIKRIETIEQEYYRPEWLTGKNPKASVHGSRRIEGVGEITVDLYMAHGRITGLTLSGDFLENRDAEAEISTALTGLPFSRKEMAAALDGVGLGMLIPGLDTAAFLDIVF